MIQGLRATVLCENSVSGSVGLTGEHGWAVYIEFGGHRLLFDTGQGLGICPNALILKKALSAVETVVLSHGHYDHTSGLPAVLGMTGECPVYAHPDVFLPRYWRRGGDLREIGLRYTREYLEGIGAEFRSVRSFIEIMPGVYLTGEVPRVTGFEPPDPNMQLREGADRWVQDELKDDLSLVLDTEKGLVVVLGCAHSGIINILRHVEENLSGRRFHMVLGGTHLGFAGEEQFTATLDALQGFGIERLGASHCTGLENGARLFAALGDRYFFASVGVSVTV
jgi:7,8-dihydropterin-6-yl-methyl-4-(beta-D-ribofuranosyl)aminobenzene 5'-phosphate synthase